MRFFATLPCISLQPANCVHRTIRSRGSFLLLAAFLMAISMVGVVQAEFWFEDFTDGNISDLGAEWIHSKSPRQHSISPNGLQLDNPLTSRAAVAGLDLTPYRKDWSMRTQVRLLQDHGFVGVGTFGADSGDNWNLVVSNGATLLGNYNPNEISEVVLTDLRPFSEDVTIQLDTFDGVMRMWAWRDGEQPEEDIAPLIEEPYTLYTGYPGMWTRSDDGPSSAVLSWFAMSTEHMPLNMVVPASDLAGDIDANGEVDFADFLVLSNSFGSAVDPPGTNGDLNGDGNVDFPDFLILSGNFGQSATTVAAVPEPTGLVLLLFGVGILGLARQRRD